MFRARIATTTATFDLRKPKAIAPSQRAAPCAIATGTNTHIIEMMRGLLRFMWWSAAFAVLPLCACRSKDSATQRKQDLEASRHEHGRQNAQALIAYSALCEHEDGSLGPEVHCQKACELNHSNSCANLASMLAAEHPVEALALYKQSCKGGSGIGCEGAARMLASESNQGEASELFRSARGYHRVHCSQGYARSCRQLAELYEAGLGGTRDANTAESFRQRAQALKPRASAALPQE